MSSRPVKTTDSFPLLRSMAYAHAIVARAWACLGRLFHMGSKVSLGNLETFPFANYAARN
jgi:hypothetical protein